MKDNQGKQRGQRQRPKFDEKAFLESIAPQIAAADDKTLLSAIVTNAQNKSSLADSYESAMEQAHEWKELRTACNAMADSVGRFLTALSVIAEGNYETSRDAQYTAKITHQQVESATNAAIVELTRRHTKDGVLDEKFAAVLRSTIQKAEKSEAANPDSL